MCAAMKIKLAELQPHLDSAVVDSVDHIEDLDSTEPDFEARMNAREAPVLALFLPLVDDRGELDTERLRAVTRGLEFLAEGQLA
jgi:hypothetical protein